MTENQAMASHKFAEWIYYSMLNVECKNSKYLQVWNQYLQVCDENVADAKEKKVRSTSSKRYV